MLWARRWYGRQMWMRWTKGKAICRASTELCKTPRQDQFSAHVSLFPSHLWHMQHKGGCCQPQRDIRLCVNLCVCVWMCTCLHACLSLSTPYWIMMVTQDGKSKRLMMSGAAGISLEHSVVCFSFIVLHTFLVPFIFGAFPPRPHCPLIVADLPGPFQFKFSPCQSLDLLSTTLIPSNSVCIEFVFRGHQDKLITPVKF